MGAYGFDAIDLSPILSAITAVMARLGVPEAALTDFRGMIGKGDDAAGSAGTAGQSLHAKIRKALVDVASVLTRIGTPEAALSDLVGMIGRGNDASGGDGMAGESVHSKLRTAMGRLTTLIGVLGTPEAALTDFRGMVGKGDDAAGTMGVAGESLHAKLRAVAALVASAGKTMRTTYEAAPVNPNTVADAAPATDTLAATGTHDNTSYEILHILEHTPPTGGAWRDLTYYLAWDSFGAAVGGAGAGKTKWMVAPSTNADAVGDPPGPTASDISAEFASAAGVWTSHEIARAIPSALLPASNKVRFLLCGKVTTATDTVTARMSNQCRLECTVEV